MKLIVCDMSGIASSRGVNNNELLETLNNLNHYSCTFCTGKGYNGGYQTLKDIDLKVPFICENGSVIVNKSGQVIHSNKIDPIKAKKLILGLSKMNFEFLAYVDLKSHKYKFLKGNKKLSEDLSQPWFYSEEIFYNVEEFLNNIDINNVCRITTRGLELNSLNDFEKDFHIVVSENEFHSVCNKSVNKGYGVKKLAEFCKIDLKDVIVIGNDLNDIDMFNIDCGHKIATGEKLPPQALIDLADVYVPLKKLPNYLQIIDR